MLSRADARVGHAAGAWAGLRGGAARALTVLLGLVLIAGCTGGDPEPSPPATASPTPQRPFTVMTTDKIITADPAAVADTGSTMLTQNVFQRLLTAHPTDRFPKPDAARECQFQTRTSYVCTLRPELKFANGDALTSEDVEFSIERAARLDVPGSSAALLSSLRRIETPDKETVRFILSRYDTRFPWALASPAASIVNPDVYNSDQVRPRNAEIVGSGPFKVVELTKNELRLVRYRDYKGYAPGSLDELVIKTMPDSASIEEAMAAHQVDIVWRGLSQAAVQRLQDQIEASENERSKDGFTELALPGARVQQLIWNPESRHRESAPLRAAIAGALQEDRTLDSVVPETVPGHRSTFEIGGKAEIEITWDNRIQLTLGYDPTAPGALDLATQIRTRLEETGGLSVLLKPNAPDADLQLVDRKAWTWTAAAWLHPVLEHPTENAAETVASAEKIARQANKDSPELAAALTTLQESAAEQKIVLPISQNNEYVYIGPNASMPETSVGPGWQLGLWGMTVDR